MAGRQPDESAQPAHDVDIIIVGAGIAGINAAYRIQTQAPAGTTYKILEGRGSIGGTWDLFKYPGIRSDSDVTTFGFPWNPWKTREPLAAGGDIKNYLIESAESQGITKHILYHHTVLGADWSSDSKRWTITADVGEGQQRLLRSQFILLGTGYYDYKEPLQTTIPGIEKFQGAVIHPQFWPEDFDYTGKDVVIIGSGATAVTLLPSILDKARHATMLQRSPGYVFSLPMYDWLGSLLFATLPAGTAGQLNRMAWVGRQFMMNWVCKTFPGLAKGFVRRLTERQLPPDLSWDPHFKPSYNPWEQRFCACMDGDFFAALRSGQADVVTDRIRQVTDREVQLESGAVLRPDIIITATGLKIKFGGGVRFTVDGAAEPVDFSSRFVWKNAMLQDLPNVFFMMGYENASWTLGADVAVQLFLRMFADLRRRGASVMMPSFAEDPIVASGGKMRERSMMTLSSTYLKNLGQVFPKGGEGQWSPKTHYLSDLYKAKYGDITTGMHIE